MYDVVSTRGRILQQENAIGVAAPTAGACTDGFSASMTTFQPIEHKDDGSNDVCPTCGGRVDTKATAGVNGHDYRLECQSCSWTLPLERPPTARDEARLVTDGGTRTKTPTDGGPQSAREILDELHSDESVARVAEHIQTGDGNPTAKDVLRTLALAKDRLALVVSHRTGTEYITLAEGWEGFVAVQHRDRDNQTLEPITLDQDDLEYRLGSSIDVCLRSAVPTRGDDQ